MTTDFELLEFLPAVDSNDSFNMFAIRNDLLYAIAGSFVRVFQNDSHLNTYKFGTRPDVYTVYTYGLEVDPNGYYIYSDGLLSMVKLVTPIEKFSLAPGTVPRDLKFDLEGRLMVAGTNHLYFYF